MDEHWDGKILPYSGDLDNIEEIVLSKRKANGYNFVPALPLPRRRQFKKAIAVGVANGRIDSRLFQNNDFGRLNRDSGFKSFGNVHRYSMDTLMEFHETVNVELSFLDE